MFSRISHTKSLVALIAVVVVAAFSSSAQAANLLGYYDFEGNFNDTSGNANNAAVGQNPAEVSFVGGGFRGQSVDINDPAESGGGSSGGSVNIPLDVSPPPSFSFGGWFNLDTNNGFGGVQANDNGGWDRGIHLQNSQWGIASGGSQPNIAAAPTGAWTYVVGTFDKANSGQATLYVGDDAAGTQTTTTGSRADAAADFAGLPVLEIGRYDNQDLDAKVDNIAVWDAALNPHQANAVRNLQLSTLDYDPLATEQLFSLFDAGSGTAVIGGVTWEHVSGLDPTNPGEVFNSSAVVLNTLGDGLQIAASTPERSTLVLALLGLVSLTTRRRRARR